MIRTPQSGVFYAVLLGCELFFLFTLDCKKDLLDLFLFLILGFAYIIAHQRRRYMASLTGLNVSTPNILTIRPMFYCS